MMPGGVHDGLQEIVDDLSGRLDRPVLVDDVELRPLAYSSQTGELDFVRTASILSRHAPDAARDALFRYGIRTASAPVRIPAHPEIRMSARVCLPIVSAGQPVGFLWLLEEPPVREEELALAVAAAADAAAALLPDDDARRRRERELLERLLGADADGAREAAGALEDDSYIPLRPLVVCVAGPAGDAWADALDRVRARAPLRHVLAGELTGHAVCVLSAHGALRGELAEALGGAAFVGEGDEVPGLREAPRSYRRALTALRVAATAPARVARWGELGADRLLAGLPGDALEDLPAGVRTLLAGGHEQLVETLETYLDHAGDAKATAAALHVHRTSLYYRLHRIEELAAVDLSSGEDRLVCHMALRLARLA
jgi:PucR C-terminal helix-turn-helix domain/GGDEF-like domain